MNFREMVLTSACLWTLQLNLMEVMLEQVLMKQYLGGKSRKQPSLSKWVEGAYSFQNKWIVQVLIPCIDLKWRLKHWHTNYLPNNNESFAGVWGSHFDIPTVGSRNFCQKRERVPFTERVNNGDLLKHSVFDLFLMYEKDFKVVRLVFAKYLRFTCACSVLKTCSQHCSLLIAALMWKLTILNIFRFNFTRQLLKILQGFSIHVLFHTEKFMTVL